MVRCSHPVFGSSSALMTCLFERLSSAVRTAWVDSASNSPVKAGNWSSFNILKSLNLVMPPPQCRLPCRCWIDSPSQSTLTALRTRSPESCISYFISRGLSNSSETTPSIRCCCFMVPSELCTTKSTFGPLISLWRFISPNKSERGLKDQLISPSSTSSTLTRALPYQIVPLV